MFVADGRNETICNVLINKQISGQPVENIPVRLWCRKTVSGCASRADGGPHSVFRTMKTGRKNPTRHLKSPSQHLTHTHAVLYHPPGHGQSPGRSLDPSVPRLQPPKTFEQIAHARCGPPRLRDRPGASTQPSHR